jgi:hypothetical protein
VAKLSSFNRECLAPGFEEEFWSLKHLNSPSEASKLREKEMSSTENMLAAACVGFGTQIGEDVEGPSMWIGGGDTIRVEERGSLLYSIYIYIYFFFSPPNICLYRFRTGLLTIFVTLL